MPWKSQLLALTDTDQHSLFHTIQQPSRANLLRHDDCGLAHYWLITLADWAGRLAMRQSTPPTVTDR